MLRISDNSASNEEPIVVPALVLGPSFITPHITDFGLARYAQHQHGQTLPGAIVGTPSYLAPEVTRGQEFATSASDVYSLGAILYELLTEAPPFQGETPAEIIRLASTAAVTPPRKVNPAIPLDLETICLKCLEADPPKRYPSADKLAEDLENFLACRPIARQGPVGSLETPGSLEPPPAGDRRLVGVSAAGAADQLAADRLELATRRRSGTSRGSPARRNATGSARPGRDGARPGRRSCFGMGACRASAVEDIFRLLAEDRWEDMPGTDEFKKRLLENGLKYYETFVRRRRDEPKLQREVAQALYRVGTISERIGSKSEAAEAHRAAIALLRDLTRENPDEALPLRRLEARDR